MKLVEQHIIKSNHEFYKDLLNLCAKSKELYNTGLYVIRQHFFNKSGQRFTEDVACNIDSTYLNYYDIYNLLKTKEQFLVLLANTSQEVLKMVDQDFQSFFKLLKLKKTGKYQEKVNIPGYKKLVNGLIFNQMTLSKNLIQNDIFKIPKTGIQFKLKNLNKKQLKQIRIVPKNNYLVIEVIYERPIKDFLKDNKRCMSIDLGINNLASCSSNVTNAFIINGKPIKSINQYYNKKKAKLQSELELKNKKKTSKQIQNLTLKRNNKIKDYFHKASRYIVNQLVSQSINTLIIGKNNGWKQETNIGKANNQNFTQIPHGTLINQLKYKCQLEGINVIEQEESYTSKVSFFDNDLIPVYGQNDNELNASGKRIKRGLYKTFSGLVINADINGSLNIMRKALNAGCDDLISPASRGFVVNPVKIQF